MQVKITNPPGAFTDAIGRMVAPKKGEIVEVDDAMGAAMIQAEAAESVTQPQASAQDSRKSKPKAAKAETGPEETR